MKKIFLFCIAALILSACTKQQLPVANYDIIPQPKEVQLNDNGAFVLSPKTVVYYEADLHREAQFLSEYVNDIFGFGLKIKEMQGAIADGIVLRLAPSDFGQAESYEISVTPKQVVIKGADAAGVFYGIQTLRKSLPIPQLPTLNSQLSTFNFQLPCGTIKDHPNFAYRGMHLDPCRHFIPLDSV